MEQHRYYIGENDYQSYGKIGASTYQPTSTPLDQSMYLTMLLLQKHGFPDKIIPYCMAQILHETNDYKSRLSQAWNWGGIKLSAWAKTNVDAFDAGNGYAGFRNMDGFAEDYKHILQMQPGNPFGAQTATDFLNGLVANKYFQDTAKNYATAVNAKLRIVNDFLTRIADPGSAISKDVKAGMQNQADWNNRKGVADLLPSFLSKEEWEKIGLFGGGFIILLTILKR